MQQSECGGARGSECGGENAAERVRRSECGGASAAEQRGSECDGDNEFDGANAAEPVRRSKCGGASAAERVRRAGAGWNECMRQLMPKTLLCRDKKIFSHTRAKIQFWTFQEIINFPLIESVDIFQKKVFRTFVKR
jgi:hypothetical protein